MGTKGNPARKSKDVKRLIIDKRREHSRKPEQTYERIEKLVDGPYLELFSRKTRVKWDSWGDQVGLFDKKNPETRRRPSKWIKKEKQLKLVV